MDDKLMYKEVNNSRPVHSYNCTVYCHLYFTEKTASRTNKSPCMHKYHFILVFLLLPYFPPRLHG